MAKFRRLNRLYEFYASDMSYKELEKLIKRDVPELYDFYARRLKQDKRPKNSLAGVLIFIKDLFIEFLAMLTPVRRIIYSIAFICFLLGYFSGEINLAFYSFILLNLLIAFELADKLTAKDELEIAREIQTSLMPKNPPPVPNFEISCYSEAAFEVGGDYYDFIINEKFPGRTYFIIGDISGKGMAAAIHMVQVQSILHHIILNESSPKEILTSLNKNLKKFLRKGSFFTAVLASIENDGSIRLVRAGHMPVIYYCRSRNECNSLIPKGIGIGLGNDFIFENTLEEITIKPNPDDLIVFYTDGIIESMNGFYQEYGAERLKNIIMMNSGKPVKNIQDAILNNLSSFKNNSQYHDDLTITLMKALPGKINS
ncbi:MAG TPA: PP2C family protein-serine/threonine phosphatase [Ignavibacteriaceae bacterium]|nr:PP2C family protein-serine/threonine phosphatase [Ignavibacteriaceae bacterium]